MTATIVEPAPRLLTGRPPHPAARTARPTVLLELGGVVDVTCVDDLHAAVAEALRLHADLVVDLEQVTQLDSCALGVLLSARRRMRGHDTRVVLLGAPEPVLRVLRLCGLARTFDLRP